MGWQDELPEKTQEFLKEFGINFAKFYAVSLVVKISKEVDDAGAGADTRSLMYRDWNDVERAELFGGWIYAKTGEGVASYGGWKKYWAQEMQDYNIGLYGSDKDAKKVGGKPKEVIRLAGYEFVEDTTWHYDYEGRDIAYELSCENPSPKHSHYSWALVHPVRNHWMFQLHKGKNPPCPCLGGNVVEPDDMGAEFSDERVVWMEWMETCLSKSGPRDLATNVVSMTFERVKNSMAGKFEGLSGFTDDGSEGQILSDMLFVGIFLSSCKGEVQEELKNLPEGFRIPAWHKARGTAASIISKAVEKAWAEVQKAAEQTSAKIEPTIKEGLAPILEAKNNVKDKVKEAVAGTLGSALAKVVSPVLQPVFKAIEKPLNEGFKEIDDIFEKEADAAEGIADKPSRNRCLDAIARDAKKTKALSKAAKELVAPLKELKKVDEVGALQDLDVATLRGTAELIMLETLDACAYTLQQKLDAPEAPDFQTAKKEVLDALKSDSSVQRATWTKMALAGAVIKCFKRLTDPEVSPVIDGLQDLIPEDLKEILDIRAEYDSFVDAFLAEPINKVVDGAFK